MRFHAVALLTLARGAAASNTAGTMSFTGALTDTGCYKPGADGGWGFCGSLTCKDTYITCPSEGGGPKTIDGVSGTYLSEYKKTTIDNTTCKPFLPRTANADTTDWSPPGRCDSTCTQQTTGVCSAEFLAKVLVGHGVKFAYCNDKWLVVSSSGHPGGLFTSNLDDVPFPPGDSTDGYRTGMATLDEVMKDTLFYPLSITQLSTGSASNNLGVFDSQTYLRATDGTDYGIPADDGVGMAVNGQKLFPVYNNVAQYTPDKCEVDSCNEHVGQGGGQPHFHGDPFADTHSCLYGSGNYSDGDTGHPPVVGFAFDGHLIYGRYLSTSAPGFASPLLDACGGHSHTSAGTDEHGNSLETYHYHTQAFDATCTDDSMCETGDSYTVSTTGPFQCFRADLTASEGSSALLTMTSSSSYKDKNEMEYRCCEMTDYYSLNGVSWGNDDLASSTTCTAPAISNGHYPTGCTEGSTLTSGNTCTPTCDSGYEVSGKTRCVKGTLTETASCVAPSPPPPPPPPPPPCYSWCATNTNANKCSWEKCKYCDECATSEASALLVANPSAVAAFLSLYEEGADAPHRQFPPLVVVAGVVVGVGLVALVVVGAVRTRRRRQAGRSQQLREEGEQIPLKSGICPRIEELCPAETLCPAWKAPMPQAGQELSPA